MDKQRATREFYAELRRKNPKSEDFGPIVNKDGVLSTSLEEALANWRDFYEKLYSSTNDIKGMGSEKPSETDQKQL